MPHSSLFSVTADFARRFRLLMAYHDLALRDIAGATQNAVSTVGAWKNGRVPSEAQTQKKLAEVFQVSVEYLLTGRDPAWPGKPSQRETEDAAGRILEDLAILQFALENKRQRQETVPAVKEHKGGGQSQP